MAPHALTRTGTSVNHLAVQGSVSTDHTNHVRSGVAASPAVLIWSGVSLGAMVIGSFGPWVSVLGVSVSGTSGHSDGWIVFGAAVISAPFLIPYGRYFGSSRALLVVPVLCGLAASATTIYDRANVARLLHRGAFLSAVGQIGWGLNLAMIAAISFLISCIVLIFIRRPRGPSVVPAIITGEHLEGVAVGEVARTSGEFKACPDCAEKIRAQAKVCRFCGYRFRVDEIANAEPSFYVVRGPAVVGIADINLADPSETVFGLEPEQDEHGGTVWRLREYPVDPDVTPLRALPFANGGDEVTDRAEAERLAEEYLQEMAEKAAEA